MIKNEYIVVKWSPKNRKHFESLGYIFTKAYDEFKVHYTEIPNGSNMEIDIICDYCDKVHKKEFFEWVKSRQKFNKDSCSKCRYVKIKEMRNIKQNKNELKIDDVGYFSYKENRLKELDKYIKKHGTLYKMQENDFGSRIYSSFMTHKHNINDAILELGYDLEDVLNVMPKGYYYNFDNIKEKIYYFIDLYKRFPVTTEIVKVLGIHPRYIQYFGGINEVKGKMNYIDRDDLIDSSGHKNLSTYEYIVAEYLLHNTNIKFKREVQPFINESYRCDFILLLEDKDVYVEVWATNSKSYFNYLETREIKTNLYKEHKYELIEINPDIFTKKYDEIQEILYKAFSPYLKLKNKKIDNKLLIPPNAMSDEELFELLISLSDDKEVLPKSNDLKNKGYYIYYREILKRYNNYYNFAKKFDVMITKMHWNKEDIIDILENLFIDGKTLSVDMVKNSKYKGLYGSIKTKGGMIYFKILLYYKILKQEDNITISNIDYNIIKNASNGHIQNLQSNRYITSDMLSEIRYKAKQILEKYNSRQLAPTP